MNYQLPKVYFEKSFYTDEAFYHWPIHFAIIAANSEATNSDQLEHNGDADQALHNYLTKHFSWVRRVTTIHKKSKTLTPSWAVNCDWKQACEIGSLFKQEAIYFVADNTLNVSCVERKRPFVVGSFLQRLNI